MLSVIRLNVCQAWRTDAVCSGGVFSAFFIFYFLNIFVVLLLLYQHNISTLVTLEQPSVYTDQEGWNRKSLCFLISAAIKKFILFCTELISRGGRKTVNVEVTHCEFCAVSLKEKKTQRDLFRVPIRAPRDYHSPIMPLSVCSSCFGVICLSRPAVRPYVSLLPAK